MQNVFSNQEEKEKQRKTRENLSEPIEFENSCNSTEKFKSELIKDAKKYRNYELY